MFMVAICANCGLPLKIGHPKVLYLPILGLRPKSFRLYMYNSCVFFLKIKLKHASFSLFDVDKMNENPMIIILGNS